MKKVKGSSCINYENDPTYLLDIEYIEDNMDDDYEENKWLEEEKIKEN